MVRPKKIVSNSLLGAARDKTLDKTINILPLNSKSISGALPDNLEISADEITNIKAECAKVGIGLNDYLVAIKRALWANKTSTGKDGAVIEEDHLTRLKAALIGLELEGYIKNKVIANDNSKHTHLTVKWQPVQYIQNGVPVNAK